MKVILICWASTLLHRYDTGLFSRLVKPHKNTKICTSGYSQCKKVNIMCQGSQQVTNVTVLKGIYHCKILLSWLWHFHFNNHMWYSQLVLLVSNKMTKRHLIKTQLVLKKTFWNFMTNVYDIIDTSCLSNIFLLYKKRRKVKILTCIIINKYITAY